jgi:drug/metabolite transporter (DMT)-like permease
MSSRLSALIQALVVTIIWSASWVLIKIGLEGIPPVTFAGLRYTLAFVCLFVWVAGSSSGRMQVGKLSGRDWRGLIALGVVYYAVAQGAQFAALQVLPSVTLSLIINFTSIAVLGIGIFALGEMPNTRQLAGIGVFLLGVLIYFAGKGVPAAQMAGLAIGVLCVLANAFGSVMARGINRQLAVSPVIVTVVSMGIGGALMLAFGLIVEGMPSLTPTHWAIIVWLAVVHTALTFVTWNRVLRVLTAVEASVINNLMLVFIAVLAWIFLGEAITPQGALGIVFATVGIFLVQVRLQRVRMPSFRRVQDTQ